MSDHNYITYHLHSDLSLLDSTTRFQDYIAKAVELGQRAICFTEHGNIYQWVAKKNACDEAGIKYLHGCEVYLTEKLLAKDVQTGAVTKLRDNYHTILIAKNYDGLLELNSLISTSSTDSHFYYKPRITFDEFLQASGNIIKISACLASPLNKLDVSHPRYLELLKAYDYLEIQPHSHPDQIAYNRHLAEMSAEYHIPLIAGTDTHSIDKYHAECRTIRQYSKRMEFADEDSFDLTYKSYDELVEMFQRQDAIPERLFLNAIENTNAMADSVEDFKLDLSFKYPKLYGDKDPEVFKERIQTCFQDRICSGAITPEQIEPFKEAIAEECRVFEKIDMQGFMLFMSELITYCKQNGIPIGPGRGSVGGSRVAYVTNIIDVNPETWHTVFSRFANEDRKEIGDIDIDVAPSERDRVYDYIISRFGQKKTAFILSVGTTKDKKVIEDVVRAFGIRWQKENLEDEKPLKNEIAKQKEAGADKAVITALNTELSSLKKRNEQALTKNPWSVQVAAQIKKEYDADPEQAKKDHPDVFYYFDGLIDTASSQSIHPAGIVASPITLRDHYGTFQSDGKEVLQIDMECVHEVSLVKYDILGLKNVEIIRDAFELAGKPYPESHEIDWNDEKVWADMLRSPTGIFQFEESYAHSMLRDYVPHSIFDMSMITAALRPSGASYRDDLIKHKPHKNPSPLIDDLLKENNGYLIYQCDVIKFLQQICGLSGSEADNIRRAIGRKDEERLKKALPDILEGYCSKSPQLRETAEKEANEFLKIIEDASSYMFGYNHSIAYCMIGYLCAYLRYYYTGEFITAYLNNANGADDVKDGSDLAALYNIRIVPPRFGLSKDKYQYNPETKEIAKGIASVKYMNAKVANELYDMRNQKPKTFMELLTRMARETSLDARQREILIKIDFFSEYGNSKELLRMMDIFSFFKDGEMKKISKESVPPSLAPFILAYSTDKRKDGTDAAQYTLTDLPAILNECEEAVRELHLQDFDYKDKIATQLENLGYVDISSGKQEDRRKLIIMEIFPMVNSKTQIIWGYSVQTRSLGSGKVARLTIRNTLYQKRPVKKQDIILATSVTKNKMGYWYIDDYKIIR